MSYSQKRPTKIPKKHTCPRMWAFDYEGQTKPVFCKQWSCKHCSKILARQWARDVAYHINQAQAAASLLGMKADFFFCTFTLGSGYHEVAHGFQAIKRLWDTFRKAMQRYYPGWQYVAFVEGQPKRGGMPHFHIISAKPLPIKPNKKGRVTRHMIHDFAYKMGWGFEAEVEAVDGPQAGLYVAKYASKQSPSTPKGFRRVRASQRWQRAPDPERLPLIVQAKGEVDEIYLMRVAGLTGCEIDDLRPRWQAAKRMQANGWRS